MRLHRFYVNKSLGEELVVESAGEEKEILHQWNNVLRLKSGDEVFLFSSHNLGQDFLYTVLSISKKECVLTPSSTQENIFPYPLTLCMALVKKDTFERVVRHATELGVSKIIPILADRSEKKDLNLQRLSAIAREASEQSGRGKVPEITNILTLEQALSLTHNHIHVVGSLRGKDSLLHEEIDKTICVWVGPEGGWTEEEERIFKENGCLLCKTVPTVMKADTAAVNLMSVVLSRFNPPK